MLHRRPKVSKVGTSRSLNEVGEHVIGYLRDRADEDASLFIQMADGTLKSVELKTRAGTSVTKSPEHRQTYSEALAKYIIEQEKKGNKFFIQKPGGSIKRFSVVRNPVEHLPSRQVVAPKQA